MDTSDTFRPSPEMLEAISRNASEAEMLALATKEHRELEASLEYHLSVGIYEASDCRPQDLVEIGGVHFAMPVEIREYLAEHLLDHSEGRFLLRKGDRIYCKLMDLARSKVVPSNNALERTVDYRGPHPGCHKLLAGSACGKRRRGRPLNSVVRQH